VTSDAEVNVGAQAKSSKAAVGLVVLSGPAGAGKTTVGERVCREMGIRRSISATTRAPRPGEVDGRDYYFVTQEEFQGRLVRGEFLEHARVHGHLYGTPRAPIERAIEAGETCMLIIDVQGAAQVQESWPGALCIFLDAPDEVLEERLAGRDTENGRERETRLATALAERRYKERYDYCAINDDLERTVAELCCLIARERGPQDRRHELDG
jgi:guanylate kinase